jgi:hypothetical protein
MTCGLPMMTACGDGIDSLREGMNMRWFLLAVLAVLVVSPVTLAQHRHVIHERIQDQAHKKRMKKATRQATRPQRPARGG